MIPYETLNNKELKEMMSNQELPDRVWLAVLTSPKKYIVYNLKTDYRTNNLDWALREIITKYPNEFPTVIDVQQYRSELLNPNK